MSAQTSPQSEDSPTDNALEALRALTRDRAEPRLTTVGGTPVARPPRLDAVRPTLEAADRLESAMSEFVRRQVRPEAVPVPIEIKRESSRGVLMAGVMGLAAAIAVLGVVAALFFTLFPREKDPVQSFVAAVPAISAAHEASDTSKPAASQVRGLITPDGGSDATTHEQSEQLLQQFVQWRQKAAAVTDKP